MHVALSCIVYYLFSPNTTTFSVSHPFDILPKVNASGLEDLQNHYPET